MESHFKGTDRVDRFKGNVISFQFLTYFMFCQSETKPPNKDKIMIWGVW